MSNPLAASFRSSNRVRNVVVPGDKVTLEFSAPPQAAENVQISVFEHVTFLDDRPAVDRLIGAFQGRFVAGRFEPNAIGGSPLPGISDPLNIEISMGGVTPPRRLFAPLQEAEVVETHELRLTATGTVKGRAERFQGAHTLQLEYPMAMVIPASRASLDSTLGTVIDWAVQWKAHKPAFRETFAVPLGNPGADLARADYDPLIKALSDAAAFATAGVVALAVGHGDDGQGKNIAWCNLVPENKRVPVEEVPFTYRLDIDEAVLGDGADGAFPGDNTRKVKLDAIDRMGDVLVGRARRLILHTCKAGANALFMQRLADRLRIPVFAHTEEIEYTVAQPVLAAYAGETPRQPRAERQWPIRRLGPLARPGKPQKRHGV